MKLSKYIATGCIAMMGFFGTSCVSATSTSSPTTPTQSSVRRPRQSGTAIGTPLLELPRRYGRPGEHLRTAVPALSPAATSTSRRWWPTSSSSPRSGTIPATTPLNFNTWANNNEWVYAAFRVNSSWPRCAPSISAISRRPSPNSTLPRKSRPRGRSPRYPLLRLLVHDRPLRPRPVDRRELRDRRHTSDI